MGCNFTALRSFGARGRATSTQGRYAPDPRTSTGTRPSSGTSRECLGNLTGPSTTASSSSPPEPLDPNYVVRTKPFDLVPRAFHINTEDLVTWWSTPGHPGCFAARSAKSHKTTFRSLPQAQCRGNGGGCCTSAQRNGSLASMRRPRWADRRSTLRILSGPAPAIPPGPIDMYPTRSTAALNLMICPTSASQVPTLMKTVPR